MGVECCGRVAVGAARSVLAVSLVLALTGCGGASGDVFTTTPEPTLTIDSPGEPPMSATRISATPSASAYWALVDYVDPELTSEGATVTTPDHLTGLTGAPEDFRSYLAGRLGNADIIDCSLTITVQRIDTAGWAIGTTSSCDEQRRVVWSRGPGGWGEIGSPSGDLDCEALEQQGVPRRVVGDACPTSVLPGNASGQADGRGSATQGNAPGWMYRNARFGFTCWVPEGWQAKGPEDSDGAVFVVDDSGAFMTCFGRNNEDEAGAPQTVRELYEEEREALTASGYEVTDDYVTEQGYELKGRSEDGSISHVWRSVGAGAINLLRWEYHADQAAQIEDDVATSFSSFEVGDLTVRH